MDSEITPELRTEFIETLRRLKLPEETATDLDRIYMPLALVISTAFGNDKTHVIGVNGAQGAGKTTFCQLLQVVLEKAFNKKVVRWSIDDLYLSRKERLELAKTVHPLLETRGVPGTHDVEKGIKLIDTLSSAEENTVTYIPRFDKAIDDPRPKNGQRICKGRPDLILFDGWCLGAVPQNPEDLLQPINELERTEDPDGTWRQYVNSQLCNSYKALFEKIDYMIMLKVPSFEKVYEWRELQESKLREESANRENCRVMAKEELVRFISHYERLTKFMLSEMPDRVDVLFKVNDSHRIVI